MRTQTSQDQYLNETFPLQDPELLAIRGDLEAGQVGFMSISDHEGRLLQFLIRSFGAVKVVEFGTLYGYSSLCMAKVLPENGRIWTLEKDPRAHQVAGRHFASSSAGQKVVSLLGSGTALMREIEKEGPFDMIFIDADKAGYVDYLNWAEKNVKTGGLIVGDNTFLFGALWGQSRDRDMSEDKIKIMKEFNLRLADSSRYNSILIPTFEGMTVAQKL